MVKGANALPQSRAVICLLTFADAPGSKPGPDRAGGGVEVVFLEENVEDGVDGSVGTVEGDDSSFVRL